MLITENFVLRSVSPDQVTPAYLDWLKDPELMMFLNLRPKKDDTPESMLQRLRAYVSKSNNRNSFHLGVFPKADEPRKLKPQIGFFVLDLDFKNGTAQTRVVIGDHDYWGKSVVREARTAIIEFVFQTTNFVKIWGSTSSRNIPSIYNYKALGFDCEGILKDHIQGVDGKRMDVLMFGMSRDKWTARKEARK
jgi:RimJ/RimL family protein N-acetyltransferase